METTPHFTSREVEVLSLVASGFSLAEVATNLSLTRHTVKNHCANMMRKCGVHTTVEVIAVAVREGVIQFDDSSEPMEAAR